MKPVAVQLYSLREEAKKDFVGTLKMVAKMGYKGVEAAGLHGLTHAEFGKIVKDLGMKIASGHGLGVGPDSIDESIKNLKTLGLDLAVTGFRRENFESVKTINQTAKTVNQMVEALGKAGIKLALHNHDHEFCLVEGRLAYDRLMEQCPGVQCELDAYWAANFGAVDPVEQVRKYRSRLPLLHVKDGLLGFKKQMMLPLGAGKLDIPGVIKAADEKVLRWIVVELDFVDGSMVDAIQKSYDYLVSNGLAEGNV